VEPEQDETELRPLVWVGTTLKDLKAFPDEVKKVMGYAMHLAQTGEKHPDAKPLKGFGGAGVLEVVDDFDGDTYRAVYTVKFAGAVYALHAFQKKSRKGSQTSKADIEKVKARLKQAEEIHQQRLAEAAREKGGAS
jgi:phage-related protein